MHVDALPFEVIVVDAGDVERTKMWPWYSGSSLWDEISTGIGWEEHFKRRKLYE